MTSKAALVEEKLGTANYATWAVDMKWLLVSKGLWSIVTADPLPAGSDAADLDKEAEHNGKAMALMGLHVEKFHKATIASCSTAREAWEKLKAQFQAKSTARRIQLRKDLHQLAKKDNETITQYIARGRALYSELISIGHTIEEQEVVWSVLGGLPIEYANLVTTIEANASSGVLELDDIMAKLMIVEEHVRKENGAEAYHAKTKGPIKCYKCGETGHIRRDCPQKSKEVCVKGARGKAVLAL